MDTEALEMLRLNMELSRAQMVLQRYTQRLRSKISPWCAEVALVISCMMSYDFRIGVLWLRLPQRRGATVPAEFNNVQTLHDHLEELFLQADVTRLTSYVDPQTCQLKGSVVRTASQFVLDFRLAEMVWRRNITHGTVLEQSEIIDLWNDIRNIQLGGLGNAALQAQSNAASCRLYRFRYRTNCKIGAVNYTAKDAPLEEIRAKVRHKYTNCLSDTNV